MKKGLIQTGLLVALMFFMHACGGGSNVVPPDTDKPVDTGSSDGANKPGDIDSDSSDSASIFWGPRLNGSSLSPVSGADDVFSPGIADAVKRAARSVPNGASQSSLAVNGQTVSEISVHVVRTASGNLVHEVTDGSRLVIRVPGRPSGGPNLALYTNLIPGIEPDLSSFPHEVMGIWARDGEVGVFWDKSPSIPTVTVRFTRRLRNLRRRSRRSANRKWSHDKVSGRCADSRRFWPPQD